MLEGILGVHSFIRCSECLLCARHWNCALTEPTRWQGSQTKINAYNTGKVDAYFNVDYL